MELRPHRIIDRKRTREIKVGNVIVGGKSKVSVQSMTNTLTTDLLSKKAGANEVIRDIISEKDGNRRAIMIDKLIKYLKKRKASLKNKA